MGRLSTWLRTGKFRPVDESTSVRKRLDDVEETVHRLEIAAKRDRETVELLEGQIKKLRGRVTGHVRHEEEVVRGSVAHIPHGDKAALRNTVRQMGLLKPTKAGESSE